MGLLLAAAAIAAVASGAQAKELPVPCVSFVQAAREAGLTSLLDAVVATAAQSEEIQQMLNLAIANDPLPEEQRVTIFAPSNDAFAEMVAPFPASPAAVLMNHLVPGQQLKASDVYAGVDRAAPKPALIPTRSGANLEVTTDGDDLYITPVGTAIMSKVLVTDVETCVGIVHVIETVLVPEMSEEEPNVVEVFDEKNECVSIIQAATEAGLTTLLDALVATAVLLNHVVATELMASDVFAAVAAAAPKPAMFSTLLAAKLEVTSDDNEVFITPVHTSIMSKLLVTDVVTCVGTVHVIDTVLIPAVPEEPAVPEKPKTGGYGNA